ncbi:DUF4232 domain-containing protein [Streptomyces griseomycini]|uniref:DUF4232 domain-containing protein n=1 Tax=Streptomyces griseomycini TaxID=66895 RepID=A0A7W7PU92_9ACTN|nr:DUF4232 domain-containing protein [Streptomyces griseomycini]MBB4901419.1 hypothetical protein [Streptomyces griseomycini]GGR24674.1 lipoprotein [Streptomyces griseomycini]
MVNRSRRSRRSAASAASVVSLAGALAVLGALASCGTEGGTAGASPRPAVLTGRTGGDSPPGAVPGRAAASPSDAVPTATGDAGRSGTRCRTSELRAAVGRMDPGAGQRNFPVVLTNVSSRTCTLYGYPGAAFVDASGAQLGPDPERSPGGAATVALAPGESAWAGLRYASPGASGARTATPAALLVTPPDEREPLKVPWRAGPVPVAGNASTVFLTVLEPGDGP